MQPLPTNQMYRLLSAFLAFILLTGTVFYHFVEKFSWVDSYYFCVVTLATIGYGDITPKTTAGKIFTTFYILAGVGILTAFISTTMRRRGQKMVDKRLPRK